MGSLIDSVMNPRPAVLQEPPADKGTAAAEPGPQTITVPDPNVVLELRGTAAYFQQLIGICMQAPVAGVIVSPAIEPIARLLRGAGHNA